MTRGDKRREESNTPQDPIESEFDAVRLLYPPRQGDHRWQEALGNFRAARKAGVPLEEITAGVRRYAAFCEADGSAGTKFVKQAASFFGREKCWREPWVVAPLKRVGEFVG